MKRFYLTFIAGLLFLEAKRVKKFGILGGMGPHAHIVLEENLLEINAKKYKAIKDRDHPVWITISATDIPDRTERIQ